MLLPILFLFKTKISDYFKYSILANLKRGKIYENIINVC